MEPVPISPSDPLSDPSPRPGSRRAPPTRGWPEGAADQARELQRRLAIPEREWHALKTQRSRRAAEQLAAGLVHLLSGDDPSLPRATPARERTVELVEHALLWLRAEISDPGCPSHGR